MSTLTTRWLLALFTAVSVGIIASPGNAGMVQDAAKSLRAGSCGSPPSSKVVICLHRTNNPNRDHVTFYFRVYSISNFTHLNLIAQGRQFEVARAGRSLTGSFAVKAGDGKIVTVQVQACDAKAKYNLIAGSYCTAWMKLQVLK
jgi:hypothetical protein